MNKQPTDQPPKKRKIKHKLLWQLGYIVLTLLLILLFGAFDPQLKTFLSGQLPIHGPWLLLCGGAMLGFWLFQAAGYTTIGKAVGAKTSYWMGIRITLYGEYYSAITPFASGGQPMQLAYYMRYGVGAAKATTILAVRYIGYISSVCVCYLATMLLGGWQILQSMPLMLWLTVAGFVVNFLSIAVVWLLLRRPQLVRRLGQWLLGKLTRLPFLHGRQEKWEAGFEKWMQEFRIAAECIRNRPMPFLFAFLLMLLSVICLFSIAYLVYRALGLAQASFTDLFAMQLFLYLAAAFMPTPGAAGAMEGGFYLFFALVFPNELLYSAMILWRLLSYYSQLLVGGGFVVTGELCDIYRRHQQSKETPTEPNTMDAAP